MAIFHEDKFVCHHTLPFVQTLIKLFVPSLAVFVLWPSERENFKSVILPKRG